MNEKHKARFQPLAITLIVLAALLRLLPHPPNFTPVGGLALFGGARIRGWQAYLVPLAVMLITDPIRSLMEGHYPAYSWATLVIYGCFLINVSLGRVFLQRSASVQRLAYVTALGSLQFFLFTNLPSWWSDPIYGHTLAGLSACYLAALPFFGRTLLGDLFYSGLLFSAYAVFTRRHILRTQNA